MEWSQARESVISPWENEEEKGEEKREMEEADHHPGNYNHLCILPEQPVGAWFVYCSLRVYGSLSFMPLP